MERPADQTPIDHIVVIYLENHTFDNLYGKFPGANGFDQPGAQVQQVDKTGVIYQTLPQPFDGPKELPGPTGLISVSLLIYPMLHSLSTRTSR